MLTRESIIKLLETNDRAVGRALLVLLANQTYDEQYSMDTLHSNGIGFTQADARPGTGMATFFAEHGYLTPRQLIYWRKPVGKGKIIRIGQYWKQLKVAAENRASGKTLIGG